MYCTTSAWSVTFVWVHSCNTCCSHSKCGSNYLSICVNNTCHQGYKAMWKAHQHLLTLCQITHSMPRLDNMYKVNSHKYSQSECSHDMLVSMWNGIVVATLNMPVVLCQGKKWEPTALGRVGSRYPSQTCAHPIYGWGQHSGPHNTTAQNIHITHHCESKNITAKPNMKCVKRHRQILQCVCLLVLLKYRVNLLLGQHMHTGKSWKLGEITTQGHMSPWS